MTTTRVLPTSEPTAPTTVLPTSVLPTSVLPTTEPSAPTTVLPGQATDADGPETRRGTSTLRPSDRYAAVGAGAAALATTSVIFTQLAPFDGAFGFVVVAYLAFLSFYALLVSLDEDGPAVRDRLVGAVVHSLGFLLLSVLALVVVYTISRGWKALVHLNFFTRDISETGPTAPLTEGGILHAIVGTLEQISLALMLTVPLAVVCAVFLNEVRGRFARLVRTIVEAMTALPSIVAGLFIYATWILALGHDRSGFAAALAISVMMLPIIIRASDVVIRLVPGNLREASLALGASQWRTVWHVVLPTARSGLTTAVILGTARGIGETSPVLLTAGIAKGVNANPFADWQVSLPLAAFDFVKSPSETQIARGFGAAATLLLLVLLLFVIARLIGGRSAGSLGRRQVRARARASAADVTRFDRRAATAAASPTAVAHRSTDPDEQDHHA